MAAINETLIPSLRLEEILSDGSTLTNPAADSRRLFLGEDGLLHLRDSAGTITDIGSGATADHNHTTGGGDGGDLDGARVGDFLEFTEAAAPSTPASGFGRAYFKSDGRMYSMDDAGTEFGPFDVGGGGGTGYIAAISAHADILQYWPLNEASGVTTFDDVIGGTDLTATGTVPAGGPTLTGDDTGGSLAISGGSAPLGRISRSAITWPANWTIACWLDIPTTPAGGAYLFGQWAANAGAMVFANSGNLYIFCGSSNVNWSGGAALIRGRHYIAMRHDGTDHELVVDGVQRATQAVANPTTNVGGDFGIALAQGTEWGGIASDLELYDDDLSDGELLTNYNLGVS